MLFQSSVPQLFNKLTFDFYTAATSVRKKECAKRLNLYHDSQLPYLEEKLSELFAEPDRMLKIELNITRKVVNQNNRLYLESDVVQWFKGRRTVLNRAA